MEKVRSLMPIIARADKDYYERGEWMCDDSPTGAHHWIEVDKDGVKVFLCKYCRKVRELDREVAYGKTFPERKV